jgi:hypothetical protein
LILEYLSFWSEVLAKQSRLQGGRHDDLRMHITSQKLDKLKPTPKDMGYSTKAWKQAHNEFDRAQMYQLGGHGLGFHEFLDEQVEHVGVHAAFVHLIQNHVRELFDLHAHHQKTLD